MTDDKYVVRDLNKSSGFVVVPNPVYSFKDAESAQAYCDLLNTVHSHPMSSASLIRRVMELENSHASATQSTPAQEV